MEIILALAACPNESQGYNANDDWVIELADLIGRSPSAVSFHLANIWALKNPGHGLANVGKKTSEVFEKYRGRDELLAHEAAQIRESLFAGLPSPRVELATSSGEADRLDKELFERFPEARLKPGSIIIYRYSGTDHVGVLYPLFFALLHPEETAELLRRVAQVLGDAARWNRSAEDALDGRTVEIAEREIVTRAPSLHYSELSSKDRVKLALRMRGWRTLKRWKPSTARLELFISTEETAERQRVGKALGIDASRLCRRCLMMLSDALQSERRRGAT
ncbi:MAG TPA: hypothetical protein VGX00_05205 [Thermoplasmata archaeon]|nr:hypothetical protein [Thermoplasmata archaeon]